MFVNINNVIDKNKPKKPMSLQNFVEGNPFNYTNELLERMNEETLKLVYTTSSWELFANVLDV